ncbi:S8 family serine peptidase [uncultured Pontibacter sp.]|uniref:S8 family serine peptidase n=1 Tax=uncultured Pontibacter sp. TaxID=453356 RepID=UPI00261D84B3|nr:S8 family serine peptidase [uncultured Pontibacter sp.]
MRRLGLWLVAVTMATASTALAQHSATPPVRANVKELDKIAVAAQKDYKASRGKALQLAKRHGWVVEKTYADGTHISLQGLDAKGMPIYYITYNNTRAAASVGTTELWAGGSLGLDLSGASNAVAEKMGVWDGGRVLETHQELAGRIIQKDKPSTSSEHSTHVAGTMMAKGVNSLAKGMSFGLKKLTAYDFNNDASEMATAAKDLLVSNHSYGTIAGWRYNSERKGTAEDPYWEWWGDTDVSATEDYKFGYYNETAASWDRIAYNAPYYLIVKSAGNNRVENGPEIGQPYYQRDSSGKFTKIASRAAGISNNNGFDIIATYGTAKNILAVGAVNPISEGYRDTSDVVISSFSSFGPTDDGRIKPDLVGNGVSVLSTSDKSNTAYTSLSGTSMAAPNVSGSLLLLQEHYANLNNGQVMRAATLKGLAIHTTDEAGKTPGPDYKFGWGLLNAKRAASVISNINKTNIIQENALAQGQTYTQQVTASGVGPLVVTISWTDPEATPVTVGASALNNRSARLINDLDVRVSKGNDIYQPWVLDPNKPANPATTGDNILDNVEQVKIMNAVPGETYTITVSHKKTLLKGPQAYALIISGVGGTEVCESKPASDQGAKITAITLGNKTYTYGTGCTTHQNLTDNKFTFEPGQQQQLSLTLGTCTTDAAKIAKVYLDWNSNGSFTDAGEEAASSTVLKGNATFTATITAPATVQVGTLVRMRVIVQETSNSADVTPCGTYAKGETQDYLVQFEKPRKDVGVSAVLPAGASLCPNPAQQLIVNLKNFGTTAQSNIPVTVRVLKDNAEVLQVSYIYKATLLPYAQAEALLNETFATEAGATYELIATSGLQDDLVENNNRMARTFTVGTPAGAPVDASAFRCGNDANYALSATGNGTILWYNTATGGQPIAAGNNIYMPANKVSGKLFAAFNDYYGTVGPATKKFASGGGYNTFTPDVVINTKSPVLLESARLYIGHSGKITFTAFNEEGAPVSAKTLYVTATRTNPGPGVQPDDPNDVGAVYYLGLELPTAGTYKISIAYENGATIYRNNSGVTGYPFKAGEVLTITGNTATTTPEAFYYYFYDMKVRSLGCPSPRVEATVKGGTPLTKPVITRDGQTLVSSGADGNQWYKNDKPVEGATGKVFAPTESGNYSVQIFKDGCISEVSMAYNFSYKPGVRELGTGLVVSPNPTTGRFRFELETSQAEDITFEVVDILGNFILSGNVDSYYGQYEGFVDLSDRASGLYIFRLRHGDKSYSEKILVQH